MTDYGQVAGGIADEAGKVAQDVAPMFPNASGAILGAGELANLLGVVLPGIIASIEAMFNHVGQNVPAPLLGAKTALNDAGLTGGDKAA